MTTGAAAPAVEVKQVTRRFEEGVVAVDRVSLSVDPGEILCLLGPSGSGKSTLLRIIGGFETADDGKVFLMGEDVTHVPPALRRTNMVFQHHALFPHLNVRDNIAFGLRMKKTPQAQIDKRVGQVLELVRLRGYESRKIDQLSGGQRQRIAIARAIVNDPAVLLLDEPLGALDLRLRMELQAELRRLHKSLGSPFIVVTHDQNEAMAMSDRIAIMNEGRIQQIGTPQEIYDRPASLFVAQFVGHTNLLHGRISSAHGRGEFAVDVGGMTVPCRAAPELAVGQEVALSIREELVTLGTASTIDRAVDFSTAGTVIDKSFLGSQVRFTIATTEGLTITAERRAVELNEPLSVGVQVRVGWRVSQVPVFAVDQ